MSDKEIEEAILTLDVLIDCTKEDGTSYTARKEWEALEVFKKLQKENQQLKDRINKAVEYIEKNKYIIAKYTTANSDSKVIYELYCEPDELLEILKGDKDGGEINEKIINE